MNIIKKMKKHVSTYSIILFLSLSTYAADKLELPDSKTLYLNFQEILYEELSEDAFNNITSYLISNLSEQGENVVSIVKKVNYSIGEYLKKINIDTTSMQNIRRKKPDIIRAILKNNSKGLEDYKKLKLVFPD